MDNAPFNGAPFNGEPETVIPAWRPDFDPDPDLVEGMIHVVAVEVDVNADGEEPSGRGGASRLWRPVPSLSAVRCRICEKPPGTEVEMEYGPAVVASAVVLFADPIHLDVRNRLVHQDPEAGRQFWYVVGRTRSYGGRHHWSANLSERPL